MKHLCYLRCLPRVGRIGENRGARSSRGLQDSDGQAAVRGQKRMPLRAALADHLTVGTTQINNLGYYQSFAQIMPILTSQKLRLNEVDTEK